MNHAPILITGASKRIGRALALALAQKGNPIIIHYRQSQQHAHQLVCDIEEKGGKATAIQADLANSDDVETLIPQAKQAFGTLGALINNAALFDYDSIETLNNDTWQAHMDVNMRAPALLMRDFAQQADTTGCIINIIDQRIWRLTPHFTSYTVSKAGLWTLTQTVAQALAPRGIRVNAIGPGPTLPSSFQTQEEFNQQARSVPLGHGVETQDIVEATHYILHARNMTGQMIALDGGQHLAWETPDTKERHDDA